MRARIRNLAFLDSKYFWIIVIVSIVIAANLPFMSIQYPINTDEFSSLAVPAYYAGHDWSDIISTLSFHGYGFTILFVPIFRLLNDSIYIYKFIMAGALALRIVMALLAFHICESSFSIKYRTSAFIALVCEAGSLKADDGMPVSAMAELPFAFVALLAALFFLKGTENSGKKKITFFGIASLFMAYGYLIHSRSIIMWFSVAVVIMLYLLVYKKIDRRILVFMVFFVVFLSLFSNIDSCIQSAVYRMDDSENLTNTVSAVASTKINRNLNKLFSPELLKTAIYTFVSLLGALTIYSGGIIWLVTAVNISALYTLWRKKEPADRPLMVIIAYSIISFYVMNASIAMNFTGDVASGRNLRWLTYIRYCKPFGYLLVLCALICLFKGIYNKLFVGSFCLVGFHVSMLIFCTKTAKQLIDTKYGLSYSIFSRIWYGGKEENVNDYFIKMFFICSVLVGVSLFFWIWEKKVCLLVVYLSYSLLISNQNYIYYAERDPGYRIITDGTAKISESQILENSTLYYGGSKKYTLFLRWILYGEKLLYQPDLISINLKENSVYFTDSLADSKQMDVKYIFILDDNEYLFTSDDSIAFSLENAEYKQKEQ